MHRAPTWYAQVTVYQFPSRAPDDPARALADLAGTVPLVDDIAALVDRILEQNALNDVDLEDWYAARRELRNLRRRIQSIHARLAS